MIFGRFPAHLLRLWTKGTIKSKLFIQLWVSVVAQNDLSLVLHLHHVHRPDRLLAGIGGPEENLGGCDWY